MRGSADADGWPGDRVCSWSGYLFTVLGLLVLRIKEPNLERPYQVSLCFFSSPSIAVLTRSAPQTWLVTPILFSVVALFLLFMPIFSAPLEGELSHLLAKGRDY